MFSLNRFIVYCIWQDNSVEACLIARWLSELKWEQQIKHRKSWSHSAPDICLALEHFLNFDAEKILGTVSK